MLQRNPLTWQRPRWQQDLAEAVRDPAELLRLLDLSPDLLAPALRAGRDFPLRVPRGYIARMRQGDPDDPLLRQVLPLAAEDIHHPGFMSDPVGDLQAMPHPGLLHKYQGRALLITTGACAVHCRYCFRRHFPYSEANPAAGQWQPALDHIAGDPSLGEIILSGGDPLSLSDARLAALVEQLAAIPHVRRLRIHTRLPIVLPSRVNQELTGWLTRLPLQKVLVVHANHAREIDEEIAKGLRDLQNCGVTLLNQSVLLRGVNDSTAALATLSETLFAAGVLPYYLHLLDKVQGAAHFDVPEAEARLLLSTLRDCLPGYLVPRLVREIEGEASKRPIV